MPKQDNGIQVTALSIRSPNTSLACMDSLGPTLSNLFSLGALEDGLKKSGWTIAEELEVLTSIARGISDSPEEPVLPESRMRAAREIRKIFREIAELRGVIATGKASRVSEDAQGRIITEDIEAMRFVKPVKELYEQKEDSDGTDDADDSARRL